MKDYIERPVMNADGTVNIHCRQCGELICTRPYQGFLTAICITCSTGIERPVIREGDFVDTLDQVRQESWGSTFDTVERVMTPNAGFKALGFAKRKYNAVAKSAKKAVAKVRQGLFERP